MGTRGIQIQVLEDKCPALVNKLKTKLSFSCCGHGEKLENVKFMGSNSTQLQRSLIFCFVCSAGGQVHPSLPWAGASASISPWYRPRGGPGPWCQWLPLPVHGLHTPPKPGHHTPALEERRRGKDQQWKTHKKEEEPYKDHVWTFVWSSSVAAKPAASSTASTCTATSFWTV